MIIKKEKAIQREISSGIFQIHYIDKYSGSGGISMGVVTLQAGTALKIHTHKVEDAMVIVEGKGTFILAGEEQPIEEGMAVVAPAGMMHGLRNTSDAPLKIAYAWPSVEVEKVFVRGEKNEL